MLDILLSDVKNERRENEEGVVTLGEIAQAMGFENRRETTTLATSPLQGVVIGRYNRPFVRCVLKLRSKQIEVAFLVDTGGTCTFIGKPTWDVLMAGAEDTGETTIKLTINGETRQEATLSPQDKHFADIDLIGTDFLSHMDARFSVDYGKKKSCVVEWDNLE